MLEFTLSQFLLNSFLTIICGLIFRLSLSYANQLWAQTYHYTLTLALLPTITMVITSLIAGNIALSLGMIGALSIVRFRNPVKSPFELTVFFGLITIGIAFAINYKYGLALTLIINLVIIILKGLEKYFIKKDKNVYSYSFEEGKIVNIIQIKSKRKLPNIETHQNIVEIIEDNKNNNYNYELLFDSKIKLITFKNELKKNEDIEEVIIKYG